MPRKGPMDKGMIAQHGRVIDAKKWLRERVEVLIGAQRFEEAIGYLRMLALSGIDEKQEGECAKYLGYLYLLVDDLERSGRWLKRAQEIGSHDPHLSYALGHVAMGKGANAEAALRFLEAFVEGSTAYDEAEFLRSAAIAMMEELGPDGPVTGMLLGALDRDLGNPWVLDALARVYEADQRWMESLETLSTLSDVVRHAAEAMVLHRAPTARQMLRNRLMGQPVRPEELQQRARVINHAVRQRFEVVMDARHRRGPTGLAPLRFPPALSRLVTILDWQDRGVELVEGAQSLWARATAERFDQMVGTARLAAAIHVLVERIYWRVPTALADVARLHGASPSAISASARVVAGRLELQPFNEVALKSAMNLGDQRRLEELRRALLFGENLATVRAGEIRLGG